MSKLYIDYCKMKKDVDYHYHPRHLVLLTIDMNILFFFSSLIWDIANKKLKKKGLTKV